MRLHDWSGFAALAALVLALVALASGHVVSSAAWLGGAIALGAVTRYWSVTRPGPMPHLLRWTLAVPRGNLSPSHLARILEPRPGERILEIGPGTGIYSLRVATALAPGGTLDVLDVQPAMLAEVTSRARAAGVTNVAPTHGDARALPTPTARSTPRTWSACSGRSPTRRRRSASFAACCGRVGGSSSARSLSIRTSCGSACSSAVPTPPPSRSTESSAGCSPI